MTNWQECTREDRILLLALVFLVYLASADIGHALHATTAPALIWPPAGIALAALLLTGESAAIAIGLAALVFEFFVGGYGLIPALGLALANVAQALLAVRTLRQLSFNPQLGRLSDASMLIGVSVGAAAIVPTLGSIILYWSGTIPLTHVSSVWGSWYIGELFSLIAITPVLIRWLPHTTLTRSRNEWIETLASLAAVVTLSILIFWTHHGVIDGVPLIYLLFLPLMWTALRTGPRMMTLALFLMDIAALGGTVASSTNPATLGTALFSIELLLIILAVIFLVLSSLAEERKQVTGALRRQLLRLEDALAKIRGEDKAKSEFLAVLAHELRNPLAPLLSSLELLRLTEDNAKARETINAMRGRVRTISRLLDDLLDVTRITHGKLVLRKEPVDLVRVARRAMETTEAEMELRRHTFSTDLPTKPIETYADPVRIEQIIVNLLNNAAKYSEDGSTVLLSLRVEGKTAIISVKDSGVGIVPHMLERVFEPFRQGEPARRMSRGLGIGLALSKNLVALHDGAIEAKSAGAGRGSEFIVHLPLVKPPKDALTGEEERPREIKNIRAHKTALNVLIVDDNRDAADALVALLAHIGHTPHAAYDGASGIAAAAKWKPQAIILDIGLPDMEGYEVAQRIKHAGSTATLIALTGYGQKEDKEKALAAGFDRHLTKPVGLVDLEAALRAVHKK